MALVAIINEIAVVFDKEKKEAKKNKENMNNMKRGRLDEIINQIKKRNNISTIYYGK